MAIVLSNASKNAAVDAVVDLVDGGAGVGNLVLKTAGDTVIADLDMSDPAFGSAVGGVATANAIAIEVVLAAGTITKFDLVDSNNIIVASGTVGLTSSGEDLELSSVAMNTGDKVEVSSLTYTAP